jgi:hypothetical protein
MAFSTIDKLYNGTSEKLNTTSTGIAVTGTVAATAYTGDGSALTGVGSPSIDDNGNATAMTITNDEKIGIGTTNPIGLLSIVDSSTGSGMELQPEIASNTNRFTNYNRTTSAYKNFRLDALQLEFQTSGNERLRIDNDGLKFNGDTAADNALNDYEEGTWTPLAKGTSTNPSSAPTLIGRYTKIGNQVNIYIKFDAVSFAGASGGVYFDGLPFSASGATVHGIGSIMQYNVCTFNDSPCLYVSGSAVYIYYNVSGGTWDNAQHTGSSAVYMNACATYTTNS